MKTLLMIKPDIVERGAYPEIIALLLRNRFAIRRMAMVAFDRATAERFYDVHRGKDFFPSLIDYMTGGPVVALELEGAAVVEDIRAFIGPTDPARAKPGTLRFMYGTSIQCNAVHASDSPEAAKKEIAIAFGDL
ncbi:MAG: nucleoside-diphosphate kinase [Chitinivibrionia bacterium]|nr:nucleoside-diphosphate kinase [Chitinivibrionia bacterium]